MPLRNAALGAVKQVTVTLTAAQLRALLVTPVTLIAAPGAGHWINPHVVVLNYTFGTAPFGTSGDEADFKIYLASQVLDGFGTSLITRTADSFYQRPIPAFGPYASASLANQPLTVQAGNDLSGGSILTSSKGAGGAGYAIGDTGTVTGGSEQSSDATYLIDTVTTLAVAITALDQGAPSFRVAGDQSSHFAVGSTLTVTGSTGNNGTYTVASFDYNVTTAGATTIITNEAILSPIADGTLHSSLGPVLTYHLTGTGTNYRPHSGAATATGGAQAGLGTGFTVNVLTITPGDGTCRVDCYYSVETTV